MTTSVEVLEGAIENLKRGWTQGIYARNKEGQPVGVLNKEACQWCLRGALKRASEFDPAQVTSFRSLKIYMRVLQILSNSTAPQSLASWNDEDSRTKEGVISLLENTKGRVKSLS